MFNKNKENKAREIKRFWRVLRKSIVAFIIVILVIISGAFIYFSFY